MWYSWSAHHFWQRIALIYDKASSMAQIDEWCKRLRVCICAKGRYFEHLGLMQMFVYAFAIRRKIKWFLLRDQSDLVEISRKGLYFYIMQLPIKPKCSDLCSVLDRIFGLILVIRWNSGLILKVRPSACRHLKDLCQLGLRPEFVKSRTVSAVCEAKRHTEQSVGVWGRRPWMESTALKIHI